MTLLIRCGLLLALLSGSAAAQPIEIKSAKVGLPPGAFVPTRNDDGTAAHVVKNNMWAPVYVTFEIKREIQSAAAIVIEAADSEGLPVITSVPLQNLTAERPGTIIQPTEVRFLPYVRPVSFGDITVRICIPDKNSTPNNWSALSNSFQIRGVRSRETSRYVVCSLGSELGGFTLPGEAAARGESRSALRNGRIETAKITSVHEMPDQWFGYDAADLVVLGTTDNNFLNELFANPDNRVRLDALLEWVRRGGRLVVSAGRNAALASQYPVLQEILPAIIVRDNPVRQVSRLGINFGTKPRQLASAGGSPFPVANLELKADRSVRRLVPPESTRKTDDPPVVLQSPLGLGLVTLVAFDLDRSPFANLDSRGEFWDDLLRLAGAAKASTAAKATSSSYGAEAEDGLAESLRNYVDHFEGVPVISFGWVALFILIYTLLIGPVEYYFLKKVLKRLELTWITFPIIVITVSAIAYFTAYAIKGDQLKLNKIDLIDVDPASQRIYGRMWLTIFSPRVERFTIGIEPNDGWAAAASDSPTTGSLVGWFGGTRTGRDSIFGGRTYTCKIEPPGGANRNPFADGLQEVPVQIWSTKSFSADWSASIDRDSLVVSNLYHPPADRTAVAGSFTLNLPFAEIRDAWYVYAGDAYKVPNPILAGKEVSPVLKDKSTTWLNEFASLVVMTAAVETNTNSRRGGFRSNSPQETKPGFPGMLFHEKMIEGVQSATPQNGTLRRLDQSWRLSEFNRDELIIVARIGPRSDASETLLTEKNSISPTKLWLKSLPGSGQRSAVPGQLKQETYVRIYVPIKR